MEKSIVNLADKEVFVLKLLKFMFGDMNKRNLFTKGLYIFLILYYFGALVWNLYILIDGENYQNPPNLILFILVLLIGPLGVRAVYKKFNNIF